MSRDKSKERSAFTILSSILTAWLCLALFFPHQTKAEDFYVYGKWNLGAPGNDHLTGINGYVDKQGLIEGIPNAEYIFFTGGPSYGGDHYAYVYRVETDGDPDMHPHNPDNTGPIAPRKFTLVSTVYLGHYASGHDNAFYVDDTGIYYGTSDNTEGGVSGWGTEKGGGILHWDFSWNFLGIVVPEPGPPNTQTLARNPETGQWWAGTGSRELYRWDGTSWVYQFTYFNLGGDHHDGLEIIKRSIFASDMTTDKICQYRLDASGNVIDPPNAPFNIFNYSAPADCVEGMGFGPNKHIWIGGWNSFVVYEIGGGNIQGQLEGIPDQCILSGESFTPFDLDDYTTGNVAYYGYSGNIDLMVDIDPEHVVTITYPPDWTGSEIITFTSYDPNGVELDSDDAEFEVCPVPLVGDIPDQFAPFQPFDLDDYIQWSNGDPMNTDEVTWNYSGNNKLEVFIDPVSHVVTVTNPNHSTVPETITFTATVKTYCGKEASDEDNATFYPAGSSQNVPALSPWAAVFLVLLLGTLIVVRAPTR